MRDAGGFNSRFVDECSNGCGLNLHWGDKFIGALERHEARDMFKELKALVDKWDNENLEKEKPKDVKYPSNQLTVVIRDDGPMVMCDDSPSYRTVKVALTPEQVKLLALQNTFTTGETRHYETVSKCILEPKEQK